MKGTTSALKFITLSKQLVFNYFLASQSKTFKIYKLNQTVIELGTWIVWKEKKKQFVIEIKQNHKKKPNFSYHITVRGCDFIIFEKKIKWINI